MATVRCEGYRRHGGAFTLGPVTWKQCTNDAVVSLVVVQDGKKETLPACMTCWNECISTGVTIKSVTPLPDATSTPNTAADRKDS
jgi:hypothetical protein